MNTTASPTRRRSATGSSTAGYKPLYDEERLQWEASSGLSTWPKKLRLPRPRLRKGTVILLLIDAIIIGLVVCAFEPLITLLRRNEELFSPRLALPHNATVNTDPHGDRPHTIPRILHQTSATATIPDRWIPAWQSCREVYAEFEYKHWTDELARNFIQAEYPWFLDTWDNYPFPIQRADAIRYFVLHHYGGIYLDMDTICNETIPLHLIEADGTPHHAVFKSTTPTGVSNDLLITSSHHPLFAAAIAKLLYFNDITHFWARIQPHVAVMMSAGPLFLTLTIKNYLLEQPSLPSSTVSVVNATELAPYITDLEDCSWHKGDTKTLMWIGDRPWVWYLLGAIGLVIGVYILNHLLMKAFKGMSKLLSITDFKVAKLI